MFSEKDTVKIVISLVISFIISAILHRFIKMSYLMGKFILPILFFLATLYILNEFWPELVKETKTLEEGLSPQFLNYGHTNFDKAWDKIGEDDPDSTQQFLPVDHPLYSELSIPRQNEADPQAFNATDINVTYAYLNGETGMEQVEQRKENEQQNQACDVGGVTSGICSQPNVYNPMNLVAPTPGPQWNIERASEVQDRLNRGDFVPTTSMM